MSLSSSAHPSPADARVLAEDLPEGKPFHANGSTLVYRRLGPQSAKQNALPLLVFVPGWGYDGRILLPLATPFARRYRCYLLDLPGFGDAPLPPEHWGTEDYGRLCADFLRDLAKAEGVERLVWIGHSFGCRVGIRLADLAPDLVERYVFLAAAGLQHRRSLLFRLRIVIYKALRSMARSEAARERLRERFASTDDRAAGALRPVFRRIVAEDLSAEASRIGQPVLLVYGDKDTVTPADDLGLRLSRAIGGSTFEVLPDFDHMNLLSDGRHQVAALIDRELSADHVSPR